MLDSACFRSGTSCFASGGGSGRAPGSGFRVRQCENNPMEDKDDISPHILNASASLLGFSFIVLTTLRALRLTTGGMLYELAGLAVGIFTLSSILSFLSIRNAKTKKGAIYTSIADVVFLIGLALLLLTAALIEFKIL
jgi:hypothetical protein